MPIVLIGLAITGFFMFTNPMYTEISSLKTEANSFNQALDNSKALESERDKLTQRYNTIGADNLAKLAKLLPESVDNIRLILEIEKIAAPYGMALRDVRYDVADETSESSNVGVGGAPTGRSAATTITRRQSNYGTWNLEFSTSGSYKNFLSFMEDLESNLRIVDIVSVDFSSETGSTGAQASDLYKYNFKIRTYWLKN